MAPPNAFEKDPCPLTGRYRTPRMNDLSVADVRAYPVVKK